jgi:hypothetical protein
MAAEAARASDPPAFAPFALDDVLSYRRWREWKLDHAAKRSDELLVDIVDPAALSEREAAALESRCQHDNMAIYRAPATAGREDKGLPRALGAQLGMTRLDANWLADEDGISSITPGADGQTRADFIPYTDRPIRWHTDGYYHPPERRIRGMLLHCVRPAATGGENALLDPEIAYILLRDENPDFVRALSAADAMTIPARTDETGVARAAQPGPVFSVDEWGDLHMRYTARARNIAWRADALTGAAVARLAALLDGDARARPFLRRVRLEAGMGIVCNNVLHDRAGFSDAGAQQKRLIYRARFLDRIACCRGSFRSACA